MKVRTDLEGAVRRSLTGAVTDVRPTGADIAGRAVRSGRRLRALQGVVAATALAAATVVASGVLLHSPEPTVNPYFGFVMPEQSPQPDPTLPAPEPVRVEIPDLDGRAGWIGPAGVTGTGLVLASGDGATIDLRHVRGVISAYRVDDGWALVTGGDHPRLYWVSERERPKLVLGGLDALTVDEARVAWRRGMSLSAATIVAGELEQRFDRQLEGPVDPVGFVGDTVLLTSRVAGTGGVGTWLPVGDDFRPELASRAVHVFGGLPEGTRAVGLVPPDDQPCLAILDVGEGLAAEATACLPSLPERHRPASVSPDGRWLLGTAGDGVAVLVDLAVAFDGTSDAVTEVDSVPGPGGRAVWPDGATVLYPVDGGVVQLWPERLVAGEADAAELLPAPGDPVVLVAVV